ncbi:MULTISPECIES: hypothetical protein [Marinomonas]|uniref:SIR2-like domain-containing protein n=1 Tax=Marinomonas rhodophyticola TaxID=2992803 RepID=A0ABT3KCI3_9GAMM|nr:hypothetical protein [Marinomonas sp. KJ51-3]MCW4628242.1 hypothetical protein [Marinomonas sp. KJ51-3]
MAINPRAFSLSTALQEVWDEEHILTDDDKKLISKCIRHDGAPRSEDELDVLHLSVASCDLLESIAEPEHNIHWLSEIGRRFPVATRNYIHKVSSYFHGRNVSLPEFFADPLVEFVRETKSHVATLNYDSLIYDRFIESGILNGYNGFLIDGMLDSGFSENALERRHGNNFGYYMHLHGSPLFYDDNGVTRKLSRYYLNVNQQEHGRHIVLTHVKHKVSVINSSEVLSAYWRYLGFCLGESDEIILFGYSGLDKHLNKLLQPYSETRCVRVVEWDGTGKNAERLSFWRGVIGRKVELLQFESILNFNEW